ncbi:four helix bundle protein [Marinoscillum furvescens]|uniref:Four helix bundle protein n=1 Tax=Marinoscillum furvescens DSM 4134 TaxID=1122208 RepID=A0A3D9KZX1_MARFU|nr:four helix bundle protein [Marinoscillum furvescens]RED94127.1 four helix bundle protein [Marinoscillum furvescens DSM 4134]
MHNFKELKIWQKGIQLAVDLYKHSESFPDTEKFGLTSQMRRCAVSIPSNIAEGCGRKTDKDLSKFLAHSLGSQYELETQLIISKEIQILDNESFESLTSELNEIQKMTRTLIKKFSNV